MDHKWEYMLLSGTLQTRKVRSEPCSSFSKKDPGGEQPAESAHWRRQFRYTTERTELMETATLLRTLKRSPRQMLRFQTPSIENRSDNNGA